ncbi:MAG: hypothetical protein DA330_02305 [Nitrososphaera sp.]|nr:hypothetical protein [Nitrososphaera sp.]
MKITFGIIEPVPKPEEQKRQAAISPFVESLLIRIKMTDVEKISTPKPNALSEISILEVKSK